MAFAQHQLSSLQRRQSMQTQRRPIRGLRASKAWDPKFLQNRLAFDRSFMDTVRESNQERNLLAALLQHTESAGASWEVEKVEKFYGRSTPAVETRIWTDCRVRNLGSLGCSEEDQHETKWLKVNKLTDEIPQPSIQATNRLSIRRSLIFVPDLTPMVIEKLATSASWYQAQSLKHAVRKHIARKTFMRVTGQAVKGFATFALQMHLPCFVLKESALVNNDRVIQGLSEKICPDLRLLPFHSQRGSQSDRLCILETHTSVFISGSHEFEWYGYAFGNIGDMDFTEEYGAVDEPNNTSPVKGTDEYYNTQAEDFFAAGGCQDISDSGQSIMNPRTYFLLALQHRLELIVQHHEYLVNTLSEGFDSWVDEHNNIRRSDVNDSDEHLEEAHHRIKEMARLLRYLHRQFSAAIVTWTRFSGPRGDIRYFDDFPDRNAWDAFHKIEESFESLADLRDLLGDMLKTCAQSTKTSTLNLKIGNRGLTRAMTNATEGTAESAKKSERIAEEMIHATQVNFQLLMVTTAVVIALQYFCSERAVFAFDRNPRTFWISICVLIPSLFVLTSALHFINRIKALYLDRVHEKLWNVMAPWNRRRLCEDLAVV